jgi:transient receptor potential cation channel subfamily M protein 2
MVYDLVFFILIISVFVILFGIISTSTLYPGSKFDLELLKNIFNKGYWPLFGDLSFLHSILINGVDERKQFEYQSPTSSGIIFTYSATIVYMILVNILLINLLIAMFSSTFEMVQDNADLIWNFQRYRLVFEYIDSSLFPAPLSFFNLLAYLIQISKRKKGFKKSNNKLERL